MRIDPHTHTTRSDGRSTPTQLMSEAAAAGLDMIGLTDHDTITGWDEGAQCVPASGVALIRGMEISAMYHGITLHMLRLIAMDLPMSRLGELPVMQGALHIVSAGRHRMRV